MLCRQGEELSIDEANERRAKYDSGDTDFMLALQEFTTTIVDEDKVNVRRKVLWWREGVVAMCTVGQARSLAQRRSIRRIAAMSRATSTLVAAAQ